MKESIIKKSNDFVEANYNLTLWEMRVIIRMLSLVKRTDEDFSEYNIDINEFRKYFGIENNGSIYQRVAKAARGLFS